MLPLLSPTLPGQSVNSFHYSLSYFELGINSVSNYRTKGEEEEHQSRIQALPCPIL